MAVPAAPTRRAAYQAAVEVEPHGVAGAAGAVAELHHRHSGRHQHVGQRDDDPLPPRGETAGERQRQVG